MNQKGDCNLQSPFFDGLEFCEGGTKNTSFQININAIYMQKCLIVHCCTTFVKPIF